MQLTLTDLTGDRRDAFMANLREAAHERLSARHRAGMSPFAVLIGGTVLKPKATPTYARALAAAARGLAHEGQSCEPAITADMGDLVARQFVSFLTANADEAARVVIAHLLSDRASALRLLSKLTGTAEATLAARLDLVLPIAQAAFRKGGQTAVGWLAGNLASLATGRMPFVRGEADRVLEAAAGVLTRHLAQDAMRTQLAAALRQGIGGAAIGAAGVALQIALDFALRGPFAALSVVPTIFGFTSRANERTVAAMAEAVASSAVSGTDTSHMAEDLVQVVMEEIDLGDAFLLAELIRG